MDKLIIDTDNLDTELVDITNKVIASTSSSDDKQLLDIFNRSISKKNVVRLYKLNTLLDHVTDQMLTRFETRSDQFSNDDLINYMKVISSNIESSKKNSDELPQIPIISNTNNTQINVTVNDQQFSRESRARILAAVQATLKAAQADSYEDRTEEITDESISNN